MAEPTSSQEVCRFLGMANYLSGFLQSLSQIRQPLWKLTEKEAALQLGSNEEAAFKQIKNLMCIERVLAYYDGSKPMIQCNAST